ncbi:MAG: hypothetical protein H5U40_07930, partial [Polyangiaceae bacterium]|nr:hypothetical protein [Polyangiaceae bacterium]
MHGGSSRPDDGALAGLVVRARNGERDAEAILCARFAPLIRTFARRRVRSEDTVDEFAQDVLHVVVQAQR